MRKIFFGILLFTLTVLFGVTETVLAEEGLPANSGTTQSQGKMDSVAAGFEKFICYKSFFKADVPSDWEKYEEVFGADAEKVYGLDLKGPKNSEGAFTSISVLYYAPDHLMFHSPEAFIKKNAGENAMPGEKYGPLTPTTLAGKAATQFERHVFIFIPPYAVEPKKIPMFERLIVLPGAKGGFYVLEYSAPEDSFSQSLKVFEQVATSFKPKD